MILSYCFKFILFSNNSIYLFPISFSLLIFSSSSLYFSHSCFKISFSSLSFLFILLKLCVWGIWKWCTCNVVWVYGQWWLSVQWRDKFELLFWNITLLLLSYYLLGLRGELKSSEYPNFWFKYSFWKIFSIFFLY